ncbi:MAG: hypothetical protein JO320_04065 [Alphaproteobacteria bacterium]|nr:hypothetical protein [Alphaproteobacteria bacterium]
MRRQQARDKQRLGQQTSAQFSTADPTTHQPLCAARLVAGLLFVLGHPFRKYPHAEPVDAADCARRIVIDYCETD